MGKKSGKTGGSQTDNAGSASSANADEKYGINSFSDLNTENLKNVICNNRYAQMLIVLTIAAFALRFYNLGFNSIWLDEGSTLGFARQSLLGIWESTAGGEYNPPLFHYIEHFMLTFGDSEFILRFVPALMGALTVPVFYFIGREVCGRMGGIIAAALLAFSSFHVYYSQDARAYTTMLLFFSIAVLFYLIALRSDSLKHWIIFGVFASLSFWTHFYVFVAVGILILHALIVKREAILKDVGSVKTIAAGLAAFIIVSLPLIYVTISLFFKRTASAPTWGISGLDVFTQTILQITNGLYIAVVFGILAVIGCIFLLLNREKRDYGYLMILSLILPFVVSYILSSMIPMSPRYMIYILPFFFVSIAAAFCFIPQNIDYRKVAAASMAILFLISIPYFMGYYTTYTKDDWRGFAGQLSAITNEGDYIVVMPGYMHQPLDYYYSNTADGTIEKGASSAANLEQINAERLNGTGKPAAYYIVTWDITAANPSGDALEWLSKNAEYIGQNMGIYVFRSV